MNERPEDETVQDQGDLRVILVGVGGFGQVWSDITRSDLGITVVAAVDSDPEVRDRQAAQWGLTREQQFSTLREALAAVEADAVLDSTPPDYHYEHALLAFEQGLHVLTAKPMATRWADAVEMASAAERAGLVLGVNEQLRLGWLPLAILSTIQSGQIGSVESIQLDFRESSHWEGWRAQMDHPLLLDAAVQHFDIVRAATGLEAESVFCHSWRRERSTFAGQGSAAAFFKLTGGVPFTYTGTWEHAPDEEDTTGWWGEWRIQGTTGELRARGKRGLWVNGDPSHAMVEPMDVRRLSHLVLDQFVRAIRMGAPLPSDGLNDLKSLAMSEMSIRSAAAGAPVLVTALNPPLIPSSTSIEPRTMDHNESQTTP